MDKKNKRFKKINPNEYGGLLYDHKEIEALINVLYEGKIFRYATRNKSAVDTFEESVSRFFNSKYALGLNNGTSALKTALIALGVKPGDRVLISSYTFIATAAAVISVGAIPIPIDFDFETAVNLKDLEAELIKGAAAVIPVHIQGRCFNLHPLISLTKSYKVPVIEDACQAFGAMYKKKFAGTFGDIGVFSFQQYKQISAGEGGLLITNNVRYFKKAKIYSDHGVVREIMSWDSDEAMIGDNLRMNNIHGVIMKIQMDKLPTLFRIQKEHHRYIWKKLTALQLQCLVQSPDPSGETAMNIMFLAKDKESADTIIAHSKEKNLEFRRLWDRPYYMHPVIGKLGLTPNDLEARNCETAQTVASRLLSVSLPPILTEKMLDKIVTEFAILKKMNLLT